MANILFFLNCYPGIGGIEAVTNSLINSLGAENAIYVIAYESMQGYELPKYVKKAFYLPDQKWCKSQEANISYYNRIICECRITHVIIQGMFPFMIDIAFNDARNRTVKVISALHGTPGYERIEYWFNRSKGPLAKFVRSIKLKFGRHKGFNRRVERYKSAYLKAVNESEKVVLLCEDYIDEFCKLYSIPKSEKFCAIANPLPESYMHNKLPDFYSKENVVLYVGRLALEKNVQVMLAVWEKLQPRLADWKFKIVGDGSERKNLEQYAQNHNINCVEFIGAVPDPAEYHRKAKLLLLLSKFEGFGMVLTEAQSFGTIPVAYPSSSGVKSIIEDGGGVMVNSMNPEVIADVVYALAGDENKMKTLSAAAYEKSARYRTDIITDRWRQLITG